MSTIEAISTINPSSFYVFGGTLQRNAPSYVPRHADIDLYNGLTQGKFCYVLTSRQMGKSSLMVRTAARLREEGVKVAILDLTAIGQNLTAEQWYEGLLSTIGQHLGLENELDDFWLSHRNAGPLQRFMRAMREVVLGGLGRSAFGVRAEEGDAAPSLLAPRGEEVRTWTREAGTPRTPNAQGRLVVFIDELDVVRNLPVSTDEVFPA